MTRARDVANLIGSGNYSSTTFTATAGQTAFTISHTQGFVQVFMNGLLLDETVDYTSNGSAVTLTSGAAAGDEIEVVAYNTFSVGDALNQAAADTRYVNASGDTMTGNLGIGAAPSFSTLEVTADKTTANNLQLTLRGSTNTNKQMIMGFDTTDDKSFITSQIAGTAQKPLVINSSAVTKPNQPAFRAWKNTGSWALSANDTFVFDNTTYNIGSHYNTSNGSFTAPVAGVYHFSFYSIIYGTIINGQIKVYINGARFYGGDVHYSPNSGNQWDYVAWNGDLYLNASDYVTVVSPLAHTYHGGNWSGFTGHLVG